MRETRRKGRAAPAPEPPMGFTPCCCAGVGPRLSALMGGAFEGPVFHHFRNAGVEVLLGLRDILDAQIEALRREEQKGRKVPVE